MLIEQLENSFDNETAESILNLSVGKVTTASSFIRKSLYDFDLDTPEGIAKLMALLPIMDSSIVKDIMEELWPGYKADEDNFKQYKLYIKGYLKDYLESYDEQEVQTDFQGTVELGRQETPAGVGKEVSDE